MKKEEILKLKLENPTWGYKKIAAKVGCSPNLVKYHVGPRGREIFRTSTQRGPNYVLMKKVQNFARRQWNGKSYCSTPFNVSQLLAKVGNRPTCYLTGRQIDLTDGASYHLDHIVPLSKGGTSNLDNVGLLISDVNQMKGNLTINELKALCQEILKFGAP